MDLETISNRILDSNFGLVDEIEHSDAEVNSVSTESTEQIKMEDNSDNDDFDSLTHYGVLGMRWGVRKDRFAKVKKRDRRYEGESDQDYQRRMERESQERRAKTEAKARAEQQKREIKDRATTQKRMLKSQERQQKMQIKAQEKLREEQAAERRKQEELRRQEEKQRRKDAKKEKTNSKPVDVRSLSDMELNDAINRLRNEKTYKDLSLQNKSFPKKTLIKAGTIGGGILLAVGTAVAKKQLTDVGNQKVSSYLEKKGLLKAGTGNKQSSNTAPSIDDIKNMIDEAIKNSKG